MSSQNRIPASFFREVWRIERQIQDGRSPYHRVGHDGWPHQELVRFRSSQHLGFAAQDLVDVRTRRQDDGTLAAELTMDCLGLTGARGALPEHYTELVLSQLRARNPALRDFLDLFNHRLASLFYRSWEKTRPAVQQERDPDDLFTRILRALTGSGTDWEIYYGAALSRRACSASTIEATLADLTGMPVDLRPLQGGWETLAPQDQTRLPSRAQPRGQHARLGEAILGTRAWLADQGAEIRFQPRSQAQLKDLLPGGRLSPAVAQLSGRMAGRRVRLRFRAVTAARHLAPTRLGQQGRLGRDSFIGVRRNARPTAEVSFKPSQGKESAPCLQ